MALEDSKDWHCPACGHAVISDQENFLLVCQGCGAPFSESALEAIYGRVLANTCAWPTAYFEWLIQGVVNLLSSEDT